MKRSAKIAVMMIVLVTLTGSLFAKENADKKCKNDKVWSCEAIENLETAIKSNNTGLRRSAIYFAGQYQISELIPSLVKQLKREDDRSIRILIALSLHKMGTPDAVHAVNKLAHNDSDNKVRRICTAIYDDMITGSYQKQLAAIARR